MRFFAVITGFVSLNSCSVTGMASLMPPAAVLAAAAFFVVMLAVMVAVNVGIIVQISGKKRFYRLIRAAANTSVQLNAGFSQGCLSAAADASAD